MAYNPADLEAAKALLRAAGYQGAAAQQPLEQAKALLLEQGYQPLASNASALAPEEPEEELNELNEPSTVRFWLEQAAKAGLNAADFAAMIGRGMMGGEAGQFLRRNPAEAQREAPMEHTEDILKKNIGLDVNTQPADTPLKRMGAGAIQAGVSTLLFPGGGLWNMMKNAAISSGFGATSAGLQEMGVPGPVADLGLLAGTYYGAKKLPKIQEKIHKGKTAASNYLSSNFGSPKTAAARTLQDFVPAAEREAVTERLMPGGKKVAPYAQSGYQPTSAELADNPGLAALHRNFYEQPQSQLATHVGRESDKLRHALENASSGDVAATQQHIADRLNQLEGNVAQRVREIGPGGGSAQDAGEAIQNALLNAVETRQQAKRQHIEPFRQAMLNSEAAVQLPTANRIMREELRKAKGDTEKILNEASELFQPNAANTPASSILDPVTNRPFQDRMPARLDAEETQNALAKLNDLIAKSRVDGKRTTSTTALLRYKRAIQNDLRESVPEVLRFRQEYTRAMEPVSAIRDQPGLKEIIKTDRYNREQMTHGRVFQRFEGRSRGAVDDARALMREVGHDAGMRQSIEQAVNQQAMEAIVDQHGRVSERLLNNFRQNNPGLAVLHPQLFGHRLNNVHNAQVAVNRYYRDLDSLQQTLMRNELGQYMPGSTQNLGAKIYRAGQSERTVNNLMNATAGNPLAQEGLRRETIDHFMRTISNNSRQGSGYTLSFAKTNRFMQQHERALERVLTPEQMALLRENQAILAGQNIAETQAKSFGSPTAARDIIEKNIGKGIDAGDSSWAKFYNYFATKRRENARELLYRALIDPEIAHELLTMKVKSQAAFNAKALDLSKVPLKTLARNVAMRHTEPEDEDEEKSK